MARDVLHVVPQNEGWAVKREGTERASSAYGTQKEAIDSAWNLAHEGDDIIIHRPDGTIREKMTYTHVAHGNGKRSGRLQPQDLVSVGSRVSWQAVLAGVAVTITAYVCLTLLSVAIGASTIDYVQSRTFTIGTAIVGISSLLAALFLGGFVISRMSTRETTGEAAIYGVLLWASVFFVLLLTGMNLGGSFGLMAQVARQPGLEVNTTGRSPSDWGTLTDEQRQRRDAILARGEQLVAEMEPMQLAWWAFGGMVLTVLAAVGGAVTGAGPNLVFRRIFPAEDGRLAVGRTA